MKKKLNIMCFAAAVVSFVLMFVSCSHANNYGNNSGESTGGVSEAVADREAVVSGNIIGILNLGKVESESRHKTEFHNVETAEMFYPGFEDTPGAEGEVGRRIIPGDSKNGWIAFNTEVFPDEQNYITLRVWGSDTTWGQIRLLLDEDDTNLGNIWPSAVQPEPFPGRWIYNTSRIPMEKTRGLNELRLRLESQNQTHAIYNIYVHREPFFEPPVDERQGEPFEWGKVRKEPEGVKPVEEMLRMRAENEMDYLMNYNVIRSSFSPGVHRPATSALHALALTYHAEWGGYHQDERIPPRILQSIDLHVKRQAGYGGDAGKMFYRGWLAHGRIAAAYVLMHEKFEAEGLLDEVLTLDYPGAAREISRRDAYGNFFHEAFEWRRMDRRHYTNQPMHISLTLHYTQEALRKLGDPRALSKAQSLWYVHEAMGAEPLRSREFGIQSDAGGFPFHVVTPKGLSREIGYTLGYGEMSGTMVSRYLSTGSERIRQRAIEYVDTRAYFRVPANDREGYRTLLNIGWFGHRGSAYPGRLGVYTGMDEAVALRSPGAERMGQLWKEHGRHYLRDLSINRGAHWNPAGNIRAYENYLEFLKIPPTDYRLPIEPEHEEDYVFGDEQVGVYAFRHGDNRGFGSFFNRTGLQYITPRIDRVADAAFESYFPSKNGSSQPPPPPGVDKWPSQTRRANLHYFYKLQYGSYLIGMNTTQKGTYRESTYELNIPKEFDGAVNIGTGEVMDINKPVIVGPTTTIVIYLKKK